MPVYAIRKALGGQEAILDKYLPNSERNFFGGKVTLRDMLDFIRGKTAEEQIASFAQPMALGMYVKPRWGETGSFSALFDKKPRVEISDEMMRFKKPLERKVYQAVPLENLIEHPELFERYPEMRGWKTTIDYTRESAKPWSEGSFNAQYIGLPNSSRGVYEVTGSSEPNILKSLAHELQHGVQHQSGFSPGGSPSDFSHNKVLEIMDRVNDLDRFAEDKKIQGIVKAIKDKNYKVGLAIKAEDPEAYSIVTKLYRELGELPTADKLKSESNRLLELSSKYEPYNQYRRVAGEIEARDTANRLMMNMEQRRKRMPYASQGIPLEEMIVRDVK